MSFENTHKKAQCESSPNVTSLLTNNQVFEPGRLGKRSDGTEITKIVCKTKRKELKNSLKQTFKQTNIQNKNRLAAVKEARYLDFFTCSHIFTDLKNSSLH